MCAAHAALTRTPNSLGGLTKDLAVELANGSMAVVVEVAPEYVRLDANSMVAGKKLLFELEVLGIERGDSAS
jgi:FKBP-type peptidyl-prolyl cis-trans isomerase 2